MEAKAIPREPAKMETHRENWGYNNPRDETIREPHGNLYNFVDPFRNKEGSKGKEYKARRN